MHHSLFIKEEMDHSGHLAEATGRLGTGGTSTQWSPTLIVPSGVTRIAAGREHSLFAKSNGSCGQWVEITMGNWVMAIRTPTSVLTPQQIVASGVKGIAAGGFHSLFIKSDGSLWSMGRNVNRELGIENGGADIH